MDELSNGNFSMLAHLPCFSFLKGVRCSSPAKVTKQNNYFFVLPAKRGFHSTEVKIMEHTWHDEPYYLHAKHMIILGQDDTPAVENASQCSSVTSVLTGVVFSPSMPVIFQQRKQLLVENLSSSA
ncbi:hypothetical protein CJ030_MR5G024775 [Morella rubra]|uniref:Uncharacterized protein n=1 Tax=Morella rubra TaxID=262757 RepID=A0A6A1VJW1_9ROSI|nr:hypothetical protein CJ030_MR5G024775 [Morella rubra]